MSNALAIAAVTAVLKDLLNNGVIDHDLSTKVGSSVTVTALPPDRIKIGDQEAPQINLFLYHVAPNPGWRNVGLASRDDQGERLTNPPLALDLYYLLSTYGKNDFDGEILLGYAMQMLHETPVLPRNAIRTALGNGPPNNGQPVTSGLLPVGPLTAADLADQVEQIKIVPQALNTEEISKLWMAMQGRYRPTAAYQASVVLIESSKPTRETRPVMQRNILVQPFARPFIEEVTPQIALKGQTLMIRGRNLNADNTKLDFGVLPLADPTKIGGQTIEVKLPDSLFAGVNTVRVVQPINFGTTKEPHDGGFESNVVPFMFAPQITAFQPNPVQRGKELTLTVDLSVGVAQRASLLLGDSSIAIPPRPAGSPPMKLSFPIPPDFTPGTYSVRVEIDDAQSQLEIDQNKNSPTFGQYTGNPKVTVTS